MKRASFWTLLVPASKIAWRAMQAPASLSGTFRGYDDTRIADASSARIAL